MNCWIVLYQHKFGTDCWPVFQKHAPVESEIIKTLPDWEGAGSGPMERDDEYLEIRGPFPGPSAKKKRKK